MAKTILLGKGIGTMQHPNYKGGYALRTRRTINKPTVDQSYRIKKPEVKLLKRSNTKQKRHRSKLEEALKGITSTDVLVKDKDGYCVITPGTILANRYHIKNTIGEGTYSRVLQARDLTRQEDVAIKMSRASDIYRKSFLTEIRMLRTIQESSKKDSRQYLPLLDYFKYEGHICIVMDLLPQSLLGFLQDRKFSPLPIGQVKEMAFQIFQSVAYFHSLRIIHTDLKPENILLRRVPKIGGKPPPSFVIQTQDPTPQNNKIQIIDFGLAVFENENHPQLISTRYYRAPEVITNTGWSFPSDIWSVGCIIIELLTGLVLFPTNDDREHMLMINYTCDSQYLDFYKPSEDRIGTTTWNMLALVEESLLMQKGMSVGFVDLIKRIFVIDPKKRITAEEALNHSWLSEVMVKDTTIV